jgi:hypothetical protein
MKLVLRPLPKRSLFVFVSPGLFAAVAGLSGAAVCHAAPESPAILTALPAGGDTAFPDLVNKEQVQELLRNIDRGNNATVLWGGYFARGGLPAYPVAQALAYAGSLAEKEPRGSARWFLLQSLCASASADRGRLYSEAFAAMTRLRSGTVSPAQARAAVRMLAQYVQDVSFSPESNSGPNALKLQIASAKASQPQGSSTGASMLVAALRGFAALPAVDFATAPVPVLNWVGAAQRAAVDANARELLRVSAENLLARSPQPAPRARLAAAEILFAVQPERAEAVFQNLAATLPADGTDAQRTDARAVRLRCETGLAASCARREDWPHAIQWQQEVATESGRGYGYLIGLIYQSRDFGPMQTVVEQLKAPTSDEREVMVVVQGLAQWSAESGDRRLWSWARELSLAYLEQPRQRSAEFEMALRDGYVRAALAFDKPDREAAAKLLAVASVDPPRLSPGSRAEANLYARLQSTRSLLQERLAKAPTASTAATTMPVTNASTTMTPISPNGANGVVHLPK